MLLVVKMLIVDLLFQLSSTLELDLFQWRGDVVMMMVMMMVLVLVLMMMVMLIVDLLFQLGGSLQLDLFQWCHLRRTVLVRGKCKRVRFTW